MEKLVGGVSGQQLLLEFGPHQEEQCPQNARHATKTAETAGAGGDGQAGI